VEVLFSYYCNENENEIVPTFSELFEYSDEKLDDDNKNNEHPLNNKINYKL
jgi:hypothetical protein